MSLFTEYSPDTRPGGCARGLNFKSMSIDGLKLQNNQLVVIITLCYNFSHYSYSYRTESSQKEVDKETKAHYVVPLEEFIRFCICLKQGSPDKVWEQYYQIHLKYQTNLAAVFGSKREILSDHHNTYVKSNTDLKSHYRFDENHIKAESGSSKYAVSFGELFNWMEMQSRDRPSYLQLSPYQHVSQLIASNIKTAVQAIRSQQKYDLESLMSVMSNVHTIDADQKIQVNDSDLACLIQTLVFASQGNLDNEEYQQKKTEVLIFLCAELGFVLPTYSNDHIKTDISEFEEVETGKTRVIYSHAYRSSKFNSFTVKDVDHIEVDMLSSMTIFLLRHPNIHVVMAGTLNMGSALYITVPNNIKSAIIPTESELHEYMKESVDIVKADDDIGDQNWYVVLYHGDKAVAEQTRTHPFKLI